MVLKIGLQRGMTFDELLVLYERRIAAKLLGDLAMAIEKLIEPREFSATSVIFASLLLPVIAIFLPHEVARVFFYLFANAGMILQKGLQLRMPLHVSPIVHK